MQVHSSEHCSQSPNSGTLETEYHSMLHCDISKRWVQVTQEKKTQNVRHRWNVKLSAIFLWDIFYFFLLLLLFFGSVSENCTACKFFASTTEEILHEEYLSRFIFLWFPIRSIFCCTQSMLVNELCRFWFCYVRMKIYVLIFYVHIYVSDSETSFFFCYASSMDLVRRRVRK